MADDADLAALLAEVERLTSAEASPEDEFWRDFPHPFE